MTIKDKKIYLQGYKKAVLSQQQIEDEVRELQQIIIPALKMDGMPHVTGSKSDLSDYLEKIEHLVENLRKRIEKRMQVRKEIIQTIELLDDETEKLILKCRYIHFNTWEETAEKSFVSLRTVYRIHGQALKHLEVKALDSLGGGTE